MAHGNRSIWNGIRGIVLAGTALTGVLLVVGPIAAHAGAAVTIKSIDFTAQGVFNEHIDVVSTDNKTWDKIEPGNVKFGAHVSIDTRTYVFAHGWVEQAGIVLGACGGASCLDRPLLWGATPGTKDYEHQTTVTFSSGKIPVSSNGGIAAFADGDMIIKQCNSKLTPNSAPEHSSFYQMPATFVADTSVSTAHTDTTGIRTGNLPASWTHDPDHSATATFPVKINCKGFDVKRNVDDVAAEQPKDLKVGNIELFRTTYSHANSQPNPATVCKKARLLVRLETNKPGPVKFKLWTKVGDAPMASKVIDAWASRADSGIDTAEYAEWVEVEKTSFVQAMADDMTSQFGQSTGWKDITLHCTGAGGGGLADAPRPNPDGPVTQPLKVTGELSLADQAGAPKDKPRLGQAVFKIWASKPGNTSYRLTCTGGRQWEGTLPTAKVGNDKYQAVGAHNFQIDKTEQIGCVLRSTSLPKDDVIAVASKLFELVKRNPDLSRPSDKLIVPSHPTHATPQRLVGPAKATPPTISCIGGLSTGTACFCKAPTVKVQTGPNAYRCVMDGMTTGRPTLPFARPVEARPQFLVGPARAPGAQPFARPANRESSLPQRPFIR